MQKLVKIGFIIMSLFCFLLYKCSVVIYIYISFTDLQTSWETVGKSLDESNCENSNEMGKYTWPWVAE